MQVSQGALSWARGSTGEWVICWGEPNPDSVSCFWTWDSALCWQVVLKKFLNPPFVSYFSLFYYLRGQEIQRGGEKGRENLPFTASWSSRSQEPDKLSGSLTRETVDTWAIFLCFLVPLSRNAGGIARTQTALTWDVEVAA